jgi:signal transduction histidine kinase
MLLVLIIWRFRQATATMKSHLAERLMEREMIARELHDTLLQGIQGLVLSFDVAARKVPADDPSRALMETALSTADRLIVEGRKRVSSLRYDHVKETGLGQALESLGGSLNLGHQAAYQVEWIGAAVALQPCAADEIFSIAREALTNAFRHSQASEIRLAIEYAERCFTLSCCDNGIGFDINQQLPATSGHWGLQGMLERTQRIGGELRCQSAPLQGTRITLTVPAKRAYVRSLGFADLRSKVVRSFRTG